MAAKKTTTRARAAAAKASAAPRTARPRSAAARPKAAVAQPKAIRAKQTKTEIIRTLAEDTGLNSRQVKEVLASLSTLAQRHVMKRGSGEFTVPELGVKVRRVHRKARTARNPMTGEPVKVPARTAVKATVLKTLKEVAA